MGSSYGSKLDELLAELQAKVETADQPLDVSSMEVDVDLNSLTYGNLPVEQQTPVGIEDTVGTQIDPLSKGDQPLDVSSAEVDVDINSQTLPSLNIAPVGIEDSAAAQIDPAIKGNQLRELENIGTRIRIYSSNASGDVYTVPTGTTAYLFFATFISRGTSANYTIQDDTNTNVTLLSRVGATTGQGHVICPSPPIVMPADYSINLELASDFGAELYEV